MKYLWWLIIIIFYLFLLIFYVVVSSIFFKDETNKFGGVDGVFFGVASIITLSALGLAKEAINNTN